MTHDARHGNDRDAIEFRLIYIASFTIFLAGAAIERLMPWRWLALWSGSRRRGSIIGEAKAAANTFTPFAFMG
jgi:hypothetical protein